MAGWSIAAQQHTVHAYSDHPTMLSSTLHLYNIYTYLRRHEDTTPSNLSNITGLKHLYSLHREEKHERTCQVVSIPCMLQFSLVFGEYVFIYLFIVSNITDMFNTRISKGDPNVSQQCLMVSIVSHFCRVRKIITKN